jgi:dTDP-glucose pyrophosphorylase
MNILIPMAGSGQRFVDAGYKVPKPLIDVLGKPMIERVVENLGGPSAGQYIFVVRSEHVTKYKLDAYLNSIAPGCIIAQTSELTAGAACTALLAEHWIDNEESLLIANADQLVERVAPFDFPGELGHYDGAIFTFHGVHPKWSYAAVDDQHLVWGVAEKQPISRRATCGIYWWRAGEDFVRCAKTMIAQNIRVNNEFYIAPVYNELIAEGALVHEWPVMKMWGLGTPEDLRVYENAHRS